MSGEVKQRPVKPIADGNDWVVVQSDSAGLGEENRVKGGLVGIVTSEDKIDDTHGIKLLGNQVIVVGDDGLYFPINVVNVLPIAPLTIETIDTLSDYTITGQVVEDTVIHASSEKTIKLNSTAGSGNSRVQRNVSLSLVNDAVNSPLLISFYIENIASADNGLSNMEIWLSNATGLGSSNRSQCQLSNAVTIGWNTVAIEKSVTQTNPFSRALVQNGTAPVNYANQILSYRLDVVGGATDRVRNMDALFDGYRERPKVAITFDDCRSTGYSIGYVEAKKRNIKTSHFVIYDLIGSSSTFATLAQMRQIADDPLCYVGLHGAYRFDGAGSGAGRDPFIEIKRNIDGLKSLGLSDCKYVAWPEGQYYGANRSTVIGKAQELGVEGGRTTLNQHQFFYTHDPMLLRSISLNSSVSLAQAKLAIDYAISWGCSICFYGHKLGATSDSETWLTSDYTELLDYIATKRSFGLIDDLRFDEYSRFGRSVSILNF